MTDRYENIRKALEMGPTPGPWFHGAANGSHMYCVYDKRCWTDEDGTRHGETPNMVVHVSPDDGKYANAALIAACDPDTISALLAERDALEAEVEALRAEVERLRTDLMEYDEIREKLGHLLTRTAAALKGEPPAGVWHSWHDLPEKAAQLAEALRKLEEREQSDEALLRQALEALEHCAPDESPEGWFAISAVCALRKRLGEKS